MANSIKEFGFTQPVIIDKNNCVVAGHGRILGAKKAGLKQVPTVTLEELTEGQIKAYRLVDNKLNESDWDFSLSDEELGILSDDIDRELFGFDTDMSDEELERAIKEVKFKTKGGKWIWNNGSTMTSQIIDTAIFITIAFYGTVPNIFVMIFSQYLIKFIYAALDTPFFYFLTRNSDKQNI